MEEPKKISFLRDLNNRRVPQIIGIYFGVSWGIIQFVEWLAKLYNMSPYLEEFSFVALISMLPSAIIIAYFHGRPGPDQWRKVEMISVPSNLILTIVFLVLYFQNRELGATTQKVVVVDEQGVSVERVIPTSGFRKSVMIFFFDNKTGDSTANWLQYAFPQMLTLDLYQDLFLDITPAAVGVEKMKEAGFDRGTGIPVTLQNKLARDFHTNYFISGSFINDQDDYLIETNIYNSSNGKVAAKIKVQGQDIFELIDELSVRVKEELEIPLGHIEDVEDKLLSETLTNSRTALRNFMEGLNAIQFEQNWPKGIEYFENAIAEDPTFALVYPNLQTAYIFTNQGDKVVNTSDPLMKHLYKLPERLQLQFKYKHFADIQLDGEKAFKVAKLWSDLYPNDIDAHQLLAWLYEFKNQLRDAIFEYKLILELSPDKNNLIQTIGSLYKRLGDFESALEHYNMYEKKFPNKSESYTAIASLYFSQGDYKSAEEYYSKASLLEPENISILQNLAAIERNIGNFDQALEQYFDILSLSKTSQDSASVYSKLKSYYHFRGQIENAIKYLQLEMDHNKKFMPVAMLLIGELVNLSIFVRNNQSDLAFDKLHQLETQINPPFNLLIPLGYLEVYMAQEDDEGLMNSMPGVENIIETFQLEIFRPKLFYAQAKVHQINSEYQNAIDNLLNIKKIDPSDEDVNRHLGRCYRMIKNYEKAEQFIADNLKIEPFNPFANYEMALLYDETGQREKALKHMETAALIWENADPHYKPAKLMREKLAKLKAIEL